MGRMLNEWTKRAIAQVSAILIIVVYVIAFVTEMAHSVIPVSQLMGNLGVITVIAGGLLLIAQKVVAGYSAICFGIAIILGAVLGSWVASLL